MITNNDKFDLVEEIYLTEEQATDWLRPNIRRPCIFKSGEKTVALMDMRPHFEIPWLPLISGDMDPRIEASLVWAAKFSGRYSAVFAQPLDVPSPKRARKLERPCDAVWTLFHYSKLAICIHDEGTVVVTDFVSWSHSEFRITPQGDLYCNGSAQDDVSLTLPTTKNLLNMIRDGVRLWVKRAKGRKMPPGFRHLWRRFPKVHDVPRFW